MVACDLEPQALLVSLPLLGPSPQLSMNLFHSPLVITVVHAIHPYSSMFWVSVVKKAHSHILFITEAQRGGFDASIAVTATETPATNLLTGSFPMSKLCNKIL